MKFILFFTIILFHVAVIGQGRKFPVKLEFVKKYILKEPCEIQEIKNKDTYFACRDVAQQEILIYDKDFNLQRKLGHKGHGPGEYTRLDGFDVHQDTLWMLDGFSLNKFMVVTEKNKVIQEKKLEAGTRRGTIFKGNLLYTLSDGKDFSNFFFCLLTTEGEKKQWDIKSLIQEEFGEGTSYIYQGEVCSDNRLAVHYCLYNHYFFCFDKNGLRYVSKSIDPVNPPKGKYYEIKSEDLNFRSVNLSHEYLLHQCGCIDRGNLYLLSKLAFSDLNDDTDHQNIHVYDVENGKYKYSIKVPAKNEEKFYITTFVVDGDYIYIHYADGEIQKYKMLLKA